MTANARARLAEAIKDYAETVAYLDGLEGARSRAERAYTDARAWVTEAENSLARAQESEHTRLLSVVVNGGDDVSPIPALEQAVSLAKQKLTSADAARLAVAREIETYSAQLGRLGRLEIKRAEALKDVLIESEEFAELYQELKRTWARLRGIRHAFAEIGSRAYVGVWPAPYKFWDASESLGRGARDEETDDSFAERWLAAVDRLLEDADAPLPRHQQ